jgi:hypothetical protein
MKRPHIIESDGDFFRVTFKSNDRFDGQGFEALYEFKNQHGNMFDYYFDNNLIHILFWTK